MESSTEHTPLFRAIQDFVADLDTNFGKKYLSVSLYHRLISRTLPDDEPSMERHLQAFRKFFETHSDFVDHKRFAPSSTLIKYSDRVFLDMAKIYTKTDDTTHEYIYRHLVTIYSLLYPEKKEQAVSILAQPIVPTSKVPPSAEELFKDVNIPNTAEGNFLKSFASDLMTNLGDSINPEELAQNPFALLTNPKLAGLMGTIGQKMQSGEIKMENLMMTGLGMLQQTGKNTDGLMSALSGIGLNPNLPKPE